MEPKKWVRRVRRVSRATSGHPRPLLEAARDLPPRTLGASARALFPELHRRPRRRGGDRRGRRGGERRLPTTVEAGSMSEGELDRLRRAVERLMNGQREALGVIDQEVEDQESSAQETLAEVQDILSGAYEDARTILGEG